VTPIPAGPSDVDDPGSAVEHELGSVLRGFFAAVSFTDQPPAYDRLHELFAEGGTLIRNSGPAPEVTTVDQFVISRQELVQSGALTAFQELEITGITEVFGKVAHRFSSYTKRGVMDGAAFEGRGVISTQFVETTQGWRISAMAWDDERPGLRIPDRYVATPEAPGLRDTRPHGTPDHG